MHIGIINKEHADFFLSLDMASLDSSLAQLLCGQALTLLFHNRHYECMLEQSDLYLVFVMRPSSVKFKQAQIKFASTTKHL